MIGIFEFDDEEYEIVFTSINGWLIADHLHYIGKETCGYKIKIPKGVVKCDRMFEGCYILTPPKIPEGVIDCRNMFRGCKLLHFAPEIPEGVIDCRNMFEGCLFLETPPTKLPGSVMLANSMFEGCSALKSIPQMNEASIESTSRMFCGCTGLNLDVVKTLPEWILYTLGK